MIAENNNISTTQRQTQEQRTTVSGSNVVSWLNTLILWGLFLLLLLGGLQALLWFFSGVGGRLFDVTTWVLLIAAGVYATVHLIKRHNYRTAQLERRSHFVIEGVHCIGDYTTKEYRHFPLQVTMLPEPKQQIEEEEQPSFPPDSWEQQKDRQVYNAKNVERKTWEEIRLSYDEQLRPSLQTLRTMEKRHKARIDKGETYE